MQLARGVLDTARGKATADQVTAVQNSRANLKVSQHREVMHFRGVTGCAGTVSPDMETSEPRHNANS